MVDIDTSDIYFSERSRQPGKENEPCAVTFYITQTKQSKHFLRKETQWMLTGNVLYTLHIQNPNKPSEACMYTAERNAEAHTTTTVCIQRLQWIQGFRKSHSDTELSRIKI